VNAKYNAEVKNEDIFPYSNQMQKQLSEFLSCEIRKKNHIINNLICVFSKIFCDFFGKKAAKRFLEK
jgi:hypothetical protein